MNRPLISVVMCAYNAQAFLREAVDSILNQTFSNFEFIIVDDGSTDNTTAILDEAQNNDRRVRVVHATHAGLIASLNRGCALAQGEYIARMDADDIAHRERLTLQAAFMETHPEVAVLGAAVELIDAAGKPLAVSKNETADADIKRELLKRCPIWHPTVLMRRSALEAASGYRPILVDAEDYDLWLRISERFQLANLEQVLLQYRLHSNQISVRKRKTQTFGVLAARKAAIQRRAGKPDPLENYSHVTKELLDALGVSPAEQQHELFEQCLVWFFNLRLAGDTEAAIHAALEALRIEPLGSSRRKRSDLCLAVADLYRKQGKFMKSRLCLLRAVVIRPAILSRPAKKLFAALPVSERQADHTNGTTEYDHERPS